MSGRIPLLPFGVLYHSAVRFTDYFPFGLIDPSTEVLGYYHVARFAD